MAWVTLSVTDVAEKLAGGELTALRTAALAAGQEDPVAAELAAVISEVRGYVAAGGFTLGAGATVPDKLKSAALAMTRFRCANRLPTKSFLTPTRMDENRDALILLRDVAAGRFMVDEPATPSTEQIGQAGPAAGQVERRYTREDQDGL